MNNFSQISPMEQLRAFGIAFIAGMLTSAAIAIASRASRAMDRK